ncbi:unnamed protein product [Leptidea sinapis]|uniref:Uncharacterized protein n=1 Tax=Leptidea sinapis TaxID=189913 RepID=A0A5E4Q4Q4_9NEOP|nr:unnamed protein product [Leptidea sinapis]
MNMVEWWTRSELMPGEHDGCAASRMWRSACYALEVPDAQQLWDRIAKESPPDSLWHSLRNCVAYQNLLIKGVGDVTQPGPFKMALVLRHTPTDVAVELMAEMLKENPEAVDLTNYVVTLLTDDVSSCGGCLARAEIESSSSGSDSTSSEDSEPAVPQRDLQIFGDLELAVLSASREEYDAHAKLVRAEYSKLTQKNYILNQLIQVPKLYQSPELECFEALARENIDREILTLREHLLTGQHD